MLLLTVLFAAAFVYWYWDTQRKIFTAYGLNDEICGMPSPLPVPKTAAFVVFWDRFKWAWPFLWDIFRLIVVPYLIQKLIAFVF